MSKYNDKDGIVRTRKFTDKRPKIVYEDENEFNKLAKSLKKYNMGAYKLFVFNIMDSLRKGYLVGEKQKNKTYKVFLPSDSIFEYVYGKIYFTYKYKDNVITLINMEPRDFLSAGHKIQLNSYKGVPISSKQARFKVDMYYIINKENYQKLPKN